MSSMFDSLAGLDHRNNVDEVPCISWRTSRRRPWSGVPNIGHRAGEQRPGLAPISPVVIDYFADRPRPDRLDERAGRNPPGRPINRSAGLIAPRRTVFNAVGRVGDVMV